MPYDPVLSTGLPPEQLPSGLRLIDTRRYADKRGWFMELHKAAEEAAANDALPAFCQDNVSLTSAPAVIRGLHFQRPPFAQAKLVTVLAGAIIDVVVDLRPHSPDFGRATQLQLSASLERQLFVPVGFAHGYCALQPETLVHYKVSAPYAPGAEGGILWSDPDLAIEWPFTPAEMLVSDKDTAWPLLRDLSAIDWAA